MSNNRAAFIQSLVNLRIKNGLTTTALAKKSGINPTQLFGIESGRLTPKLETLEVLAEAFGLGIKLTLVAGEFELNPVYATKEYKPAKGTYHKGQWYSAVYLNDEQNEHVVREIIKGGNISRSEAFRRIVQRDLEREREQDAISESGGSTGRVRV